MSSVFSLYLFLPTMKMLSLISFFVALLNERRIGVHVLLLDLNVFQAAHGSTLGRITMSDSRGIAPANMGCCSTSKSYLAMVLWNSRWW